VIPPASDATPIRRGAGGLLALALLLAVGISATGWFYFKRQQADTRRTAQEMLTTIADLKVGQIAGWMKERRADAETNQLTAIFVTILKKAKGG